MNSQECCWYPKWFAIFQLSFQAKRFFRSFVFDVAKKHSHMSWAIARYQGRHINLSSLVNIVFQDFDYHPPGAYILTKH